MTPRQSSILGMIIIVLGFIALFIALQPFLQSILFLFLAFYLISYGLRMRGMGSAMHYGRTIWFNMKRFR